MIGRPLVSRETARAFAVSALWSTSSQGSNPAEARGEGCESLLSPCSIGAMPRLPTAAAAAAATKSRLDTCAPLLSLDDGMSPNDHETEAPARLFYRSDNCRPVLIIATSEA